MTLWHGCTARDAVQIQKKIDLNKSRCDADFGRGFYLTSLERQARQWAWYRFYSLSPRQRSGTTAQVLKFRVPRAKLARLEFLAFVLPSYDNLDLWSLVQHCRQSPPAPGHHHHNHPDASARPDGWYDMVIGPVAAFWQQRVAMVDADQISFHTKKAVDILQGLIKSGNSGNHDDFAIVPVP